MHPERRQHRSSTPSEALHLYLSALARRSASSRLVVADEDGLVLDGVGKADELEVLAAYGERAPVGEVVHSTLLPTAQADFRLTATGGRRPSSKEAAAALARIMLSD